MTPAPDLPVALPRQAGSLRPSFGAAVLPPARLARPAPARPAGLAVPRSFPQIDVLRGFAALSVVVFHVIAHFNWTSFPVSGPLVWFRIGGFGVDLFFVISGFVIALSAFGRLEAGPYRGFLRAFTRARLARIVPLYYLTCLVFLIFSQPALVFVPGIWRQVLSHAVFLHSWIPSHSGGIDGVNWSVSVEMQFYAAMLLLAPWLRRTHWVAIAAAGMGLAWCWRAAVFFLVRAHAPGDTFQMFVFTTELPGMADEFAAGILLARLVCSPAGQVLLRWAGRWFFVVPAVTVAVLAAVLHVYWQHGAYWNSPAMVTAFRTPMALAAALLVLSACTLQSPAALRITAPLRYLGTISYGIYLWHLPVLLALKRVSWVDGPTALPYVIGLTLLLASLSWHFFERPFMQRAGRVRPRPAAGSAGPPA